MKVECLFYLTTLFLTVNSEYPRPKRRGPPPPLLPSKNYYMKKWPSIPPNLLPYKQPQLPQMPQQVRNRQKPIHIPASLKIPMESVQMPFTQQNSWKNNQINLKFEQEEFKQKPIFKLKEKPFLSSSSQRFPEPEYHVEANSIPTHANPIQQVGEKGPIHTIPAPNLSPADKPPGIFDENKFNSFNHQRTQLPGHVSHQYQVTETSEQLPKQKLNNPHLHTQELTFSPQEHQKDTIQYHFQTQQFPAANVMMPHHNLEAFAFPQLVREVASGHSLHTQATQTGLSNAQEDVTAHHTLFAQPNELYQPESQVLDAVHVVASEKSVNVQPEFHNFNYDEQAYRKAQLVGAGYSLDRSDMPGQIIHGINSRSDNVDAEEQSKMVQNYFDNRSKQPTSEKNQIESDAQHQKFLTPHLYSSLPNKEAADLLAELQAAGKINSNLKKIHPTEVMESKDPMRIYLPDEYDENAKENKKSENHNDSKEYEDYTEDDEVEDDKEERLQNNKFGEKLHDN